MLQSSKFKSCRHKMFTTCLLLSLLSLCSGNMLELVEKLKKQKVIKSDVVSRTMLMVDRQKYCPKAQHPYADIQQSIGYGATISAPHIHAHALELLKHHLTAGTSALDIGSGSGYMTVCMAIMLGDGGMSTGIEHIPELVIEAYNNTEKNHKSLISGKRLKYIIGDGREGYKPHAPYDAIYAGANFKHIPSRIFEQLRRGGRFVGPTGDLYTHYLTVIDKNIDGTFTAKKISVVNYYEQVDDKNVQLKRMRNNDIVI